MKLGIKLLLKNPSNYQAEGFFFVVRDGYLPFLTTRFSLLYITSRSSGFAILKVSDMQSETTKLNNEITKI